MTTLRLATLTTAFAFCVIVLGAWVRLTEAGLGCPDWPGCFGRIVVPEAGHAAEHFPDKPLDSGKAWREMTHRYAAGTLGLLIAALAVVALRRRAQPGAVSPVLPLALVVLVGFQAWLGQLTVMLVLQPLVVMGHLLGGLTTLALLLWVALDARPRAVRGAESATLGRLAVAALCVLAAQIALGGWTSSHYAALACPDFPTCHGRWWPAADFREGFIPWHAQVADFTGGTLEHPARVAIYLTHRIGALVTTIVLGAVVATVIIRARHPAPRRAAVAVALALLAQVALGISMAKVGLPLSVALAHNAVAAVLLACVVTMNHTLWRTG